MSLSGVKVYVSLAVLLLFGRYAESLIVPEELPTILSLIYSNIPPIKKGTDSRIGVGFRLGEHADFQVLVEYGPQKETDAIGIDKDSKRKRAALIASALKGNMGPLAQALAKYQMELKIKKLTEQYKIEPGLNAVDNSSNNSAQKIKGDDWLSKWSQGITVNSDDAFLVETSPRKISPNTNRVRVVSGQASSDNQKDESAKQDLITLKKLFGRENENETKSVD